MIRICEYNVPTLYSNIMFIFYWNMEDLVVYLEVGYIKRTVREKTVLILYGFIAKNTQRFT